MLMRNALAALLLLAATPCVSKPVAARTAPATAPDSRLAAAVDAVAAKALADKTVSGFAVGVVENGRVRLARGYGFADLETRTPVTARTVFRIGSITKEFTAAAVLLLAEQGRLSIDDPLAKYLPTFPRAGDVTVRQLLTHTSGIHNYTSLPDFLPAVSPRDLSTDAMVAVMADADPLYDFAPGTSWSYSNSGFFLLGAIIEKVSGQSYARYLQANILEPLKLSQTKLDDLAEIVPNRARGYDRAAGSPTGFANAGHISMSVAAAAGAVRSTVGDLARWHEALLGGRLLKPASLALMTAPGRLKDGRLASAARPATPGEAGSPSDYGFGIATSRRDGRRSIGHGGSINGFNAALQTFPDVRTTVVLLTNTSGGTATLFPALVDAILPSATPAAKPQR